MRDIAAKLVGCVLRSASPLRVMPGLGLETQPIALGQPQLVPFHVLRRVLSDLWVGGFRMGPTSIPLLSSNPQEQRVLIVSFLTMGQSQRAMAWPIGPYETVMAAILLATIPLQRLLTRDEPEMRVGLRELGNEIRGKGYRWHISLYVVMYEM